MNLQTTHIERTNSRRWLSPQRLLRRLEAVVSRLVASRYPTLDLETMEPHMLRDLGFRDGRDPRYERDETR